MKIKDSLRVEIEMEQKMSNESKKNFGDYFELKLHLRMQYFKDIQKGKEELYNAVMNNLYGINKFDEVDNGFDFYFADHSSMTKVVNFFKKNYLVVEKKSGKLAGVDRMTSKLKYKYALAIIVVNLKRGDNVMIKGKEYKIKAVNKMELVLIEKGTSNKSVINYLKVKDYLQLL